MRGERVCPQHSDRKQDMLLVLFTPVSGEYGVLSLYKLPTNTASLTTWRGARGRRGKREREGKGRRKRSHNAGLC